MSDYGLKVFDSSGNTVLDTTDTITRFRYSNEVAAGTSGNITLSDISGLSSVEISVCTEFSATGWDKCAHSILRSGTTLTWSAQSGTYYSSSNSLVFLFLYS